LNSWQSMNNRSFNLLLSGQLVSQLGDKVHMLAVAYLVLKTTGSPAQMGLVLFCSVFPSMFLGLVAGALLDRYSRKLIIISADIARGLIVAGLGLLYFLDVLSFPMLLIAQVLLSICTAFFDPAIPAIIPQIIPENELGRANSQTQLARGIAMIAGPALGGLLVAWAGYLPIFLINSASYLISAGFECFIQLPETPEPGPANTGIRQDITQGWAYVRGKSGLLMILLMVGVIHFFVGSVESLMPLFATSLKGQGAENLGYLQTFFGLGTIVAAAYISFRKIKARDSTLLFMGVFAFGFFMMQAGLMFNMGAQSRLLLLGLLLAMGGAMIFAGTSFRSILQKRVDSKMTGRVFGLVSCVGNSSIPLAMLVYGYLLEFIPAGSLALVSGLVLMPMGLVCHRRYQNQTRPDREATVAKQT
jgi:DHA3 family macrolide efflux protein-like MFS transporter